MVISNILKKPLPCPFCGNDPTVKIQLTESDSKSEMAGVGCLNPHCHVRPKVSSVMGIGESEQSAIRRWNIRK